MRNVVFTGACALALAAIGLGGCATTDPLDAASIRYHLPRTDAQASLTVDLVDCHPVKLEAELALSAQSGADDRTYEISGRALGSSRIARAMEFDVNDKGVITGVNAGLTDKTAQIVGDLAKIAATALAGAAAAPVLQPGEQPPPMALACTTEASAALREVTALKTEITRLRGEISAHPTAADVPKKIKDVNAYAAQVAALTTGDGLLHIDATADISLDKAKKESPDEATRKIKLPAAKFRKWFGDGSESSVDYYLGLAWSATTDPTAPTPANLAEPHYLNGCEHYILLPRTQAVTVTATPTKHSLIVIKSPAQVTTPLAQWSDPAHLCTDVAFGENRTIQLAFDNYGSTTKFQWNSDATLANITSAAAGAAPDITKITTYGQGATLAHQKAEIDALSTQQSLNQWRACQAILDAGGYSCPKPADSGS